MNLLCFKKGDLPDMLIFIVTVLIFAIGLFIFAFIIPEITDKMTDTTLNDSSEAREVLDELAELGATGMQKGFLFLFFGLVIGTMITSFLTRTHPIFIFMYIFFLIITLFVGGYLGNAFEQLASSEILSDTLASQGYITIIMQHIVEITLVVGALSMIIVFAKFSRFGGQSNPL